MAELIAERIVEIKLLADLRQAAALGPRGWGDLVRAVAELAVARRSLAQSDLQHLIGKEETEAGGALSTAETRKVERVAYAIQRMAARVPWRSDCLVQALSARRWLAREGIAAQLHIGVRNQDGFAAHAWLKVGDMSVTGETGDEFTVLIGGRANTTDQARTASAFATNQR